jgi:hypothetical protein
MDIREVFLAKLKIKRESVGVCQELWTLNVLREHSEHAHDVLVFPDRTEAIDIFANQGGAWLETQYPHESRDDDRFIIDNTVLNLPVDVRDGTTNLLWETRAIIKCTCRRLHDLLR